MTVAKSPLSPPLSGLGEAASFKDWQGAIRSIRLLHVQDRHQRCAQQCKELLDRNDIRPAHAAAVHFYYALSHEMIAEPLGTRNERVELERKLDHLQTASHNFGRALQRLPVATSTPPLTPLNQSRIRGNSDSPPEVPPTPTSGNRRSAIPRAVGAPQDVIIVNADAARELDMGLADHVYEMREKRLSISEFPTPPTFVRPRPGRTPRLDFTPRPTLNRRKRPAALTPRLNSVREVPSEGPVPAVRPDSPTLETPCTATFASPKTTLSPSTSTLSPSSSTRTLSPPHYTPPSMRPPETSHCQRRDFLPTPLFVPERPSWAISGQDSETSEAQIDARLLKQMQALEPILVAHKKHTEALVAETQARIDSVRASKGLAEMEMDGRPSLDSDTRLSTITTGSLEMICSEKMLLMGRSVLQTPQNSNEVKTIRARIAEGRSRGWQRPRYDPTRTRQLCNNVLAELDVRSA